MILQMLTSFSLVYVSQKMLSLNGEKGLIKVESIITVILMMKNLDGYLIIVVFSNMYSCYIPVIKFTFR